MGTLAAERRQLEAVLISTEEGILLIEDSDVKGVILANLAVRRTFDSVSAAMRDGQPAASNLPAQALVE